MMKPRTATKAFTALEAVNFYAAVLTIFLIFVASGVVTYVNTRTLMLDAGLVTHTHDVLSVLEDVLSLTKDAETGQRGYLITGDDRYLAPYNAAIARVNLRLSDVERLVTDNPTQQSRIPELREKIDLRLRLLEEGIAIRREQGFDAARTFVLSDRGKVVMDEVRAQTDAIRQVERTLLTERDAEMQAAYRTAVFSGVVTGILGAVLATVVAYLVRRTNINRRRQEWLQQGQLGLSNAMAGDQRLEQLGESALRFLVDYLDAHAGVFFVRDQQRFRPVAVHSGFSGDQGQTEFRFGDGLLGQTAKDGRSTVIRNVPEGYLTISSALGRSKTRDLVVAPTAADGIVNGVIELGFLHPLDPLTTELLDHASEATGIAVRSAIYRNDLQNLLEETQRQAEELQTQAEELRVSNEELEEQGRALRESQARLEVQQAQLEESNAQLEEQSQQLESQRDELTRTSGRLRSQADELERAGRYKSDFLANISHELRTPLNSSLILAKLLADNPQGNLTDEQVRFAETIRSAGNDLLNLINDVLDLSKIEAGRMEIRPESVSIRSLTEDLRRMFAPIAQEKKLSLTIDLQDSAPEYLETDRQRLEQVLKNLLSNACKFTEQGSVTLSLRRAAGRVQWDVADTGIGIPAEQQQVVFEAFRQADGTTNRKYGGTGLGLSISRELVRLLGGDLLLSSEPGRGSTFSVLMPETYDAALVRPHVDPTSQPAVTAAEPAPEPLRKPVKPRPRRVSDDRETLSVGRRTILAVEDDEAFARILADLAHELDFQCLIATTAEEGMALAAQHLPSAVLLDIGLPDHSGLTVLDRLKHDARTRHIPVHVVSGSDHAETALSLGAVGYIIKPVQRDELVEALKKLETRFEQRMRRVLVVEDDPVQLDGVRRLLGTHDVETVGVGTAAECLHLLKSATFDCMVLDLTLPDATGYSLLETLSREDAYSFPPVIVYTGRELSPDEEQQLRKYSKSIIIKGAKSPERLLDEVTLFLHQVVADLPAAQQRMLERARSRDAALEGRRILVVEDDVRNIFAVTSVLEPRGATVQIARNGREALTALNKAAGDPNAKIDLVLMDVMMPEMDGLTATREIRKLPEWKKLPIVVLTAKAMPDDQQKCLDAGANDYLAKPLDVEKLLSLVRVWMPR
jgi:CheY-like chemotaxis protein